MKSINMTEEELLEKARLLYPEGTEHRGSVNTPSSRFIVRGSLYFESGNIYSKDASGCIYIGDENRWATIISSPIPQVITDYSIY